MAEDYVPGEMEISDQESTWSAFMKVTWWGSFMTVLVVGYATLTLSAGVNWAVALGGFAILGIAGGLFMNMGGAWIATVIGLAVVGALVQLIITLVNMAAGG